MNIYQVLEQHSIPYKKFDHEAVFGCDAAGALGLDTLGIATKNLF
jgi:Ala-tRNA(Pro) deacylase